MTLIARPRQKGKTSQLIKMADSQPKLIVCSSRSEAHVIARMAGEMECNIHLPITYDDFIQRRYSVSHVKGILIDDIDRLIEYISKVPIEAVTYSGLVLP